MPTINQLKEQEQAGTPIFLFDCTLVSGDELHWSTHGITVSGNIYDARVLRHNLFDLQASSNDGIDSLSKITLILANADSQLSAVERDTGWKGAQLTIQFVFFDLNAGAPASESTVVFRGYANPPENSLEDSLQLSFTNRLNLQRIYLPEIRIQRRCPWTFPSDAAERQEAVNGGTEGAFSAFYRCGYSPDQTGGVGNLNSGTPFTTCDFTRTACTARGMFDKDSNSTVTRRFGGIEFVPAWVLVRSYGEKGQHLSPVLDNQARYNDFVPLTYGTAWYAPPVVFARNDGNLTRLEVLLSAGEIQGVVKVIVNDVEIPLAQAGANMTATGWYSVVTAGTRNGAFNFDFTDANGNPLGDPYGSMAFMSLVVPNRISDGQSLPTIEVLIQGLKLATYDTSGNFVSTTFTNNPAWVLLDTLRRSGWQFSEVDLPTFASVAQRCSQTVTIQDANGNSNLIPAYQCNFVLTKRRSAADVVRGIRNGSGLYLVMGASGLLEIHAEDAIANQQPSLPDGSNSTEPLNGGWPAYEFGDVAPHSGITRKSNGSSSFRTYARSAADSPNLYTVEFQDEFNEYQQDSLSLVDVDDVRRAGQEVSTTLTALGLPNFDQAGRAMSLQLNKSVAGNTYAEFETSVKGVKLRPGDIITLTYAKEGWTRQPFRIVRIQPGPSYRTSVITVEIHDDAWYTTEANLTLTGGRRIAAFEVGLPRPLTGTETDAEGHTEFGVAESAVESADGSFDVNLSVAFSTPQNTEASAALIPLVGLNATFAASGGTLTGAATYYYGISAVDGTGTESALSFIITASVPAGTNTNTVTLNSLSFSPGTSGFNVYRGITPAQLLRIASNQPVAAQFTDTGIAATSAGPPDPNYDHANFYWRFELQPEYSADIFSATTIGNSGLQMAVNQYQSAIARITDGTGYGQERPIAANTATTLTVSTKWDIVPDATSKFVVAESSWRFGSTGSSSPIAFQVPNRPGMTVHVSGRAANVRNEETAYELSPLTSWQIGGASGSGTDADVPGQPSFGLGLTGRGTVNVGAISFADLTNTRTIAAGTLTLSYWDELDNPSAFHLASGISASDTTITLNTAASAQINDLVQIESEVMIVQGVLNGGLGYQVTRGAYGTTAVVHNSTVLVYPLQKKTFVLPFPRGFFGSPASGSYTFSLPLPDVRIATAELFMTNSQGNSDVNRQPFTENTDQGLRTLSGGQLSIQVESLLAIQTDAAPPLIMDAAHSIFNVFATVGTPPTAGASIELMVTQNGQPYCPLTIPNPADPTNTTTSNVVPGFALGPLQAGALIGLDITSVTTNANELPGRDLTVTIRL